MKKIMPVLLLFFLSNISLFAQDSAISKYFGRYLDDSSFDKFKVSEKSFSLFREIETQEYEEQQIIDALIKLEGILVVTKKETDNGYALYNDAVKTIEQDGNYETLLSVEHNGENVQILIREELSTIREFLLIAGGERNFVIASLYGDIELSKIMQLGKILKSDGSKWMELVEGKDTKELVFKKEQLGKSSRTISRDMLQFEDIQVYPNVVIDKVKIQDKTAANGTYQLEFFSLLGEPIQTKAKIALPYTLEFNDLPSGAYFIRLTNAEGGYKNFRIVKP